VKHEPVKQPPMTGDELTFMMGQFAARFPTDRRYATNHMWAQAVAPRRWRFGFSAYAVRLLQDVYFLDWTIDAPARLRQRQPIGAIESRKAESELYAPIDGRLIEFNQQLLADPSAINVDTYAQGWLFEMEGAGESLLDPAAYLVHLEAAWKVAERTIKGQWND
jgi:glycine cleavage system H protein